MSNDLQNVSPGWIVAGIVTIIATLAGAVKLLFSMREGDNAKHIEKLESRLNIAEQRLLDSDRKHDECNEDRMRLSIKVAEFEAKLTILERKESVREQA